MNHILRLTSWASAAYQFRHAHVEGYKTLNCRSSAKSASYSLDTGTKSGASGKRGADEGSHSSARLEPEAIKYAPLAEF